MAAKSTAGPARRKFARARALCDSGMAPEPLEMAQNGLAQNGVAGSWPLATRIEGDCVQKDVVLARPALRLAAVGMGRVHAENAGFAGEELELLESAGERRVFGMSVDVG